MLSSNTSGSPSTGGKIRINPAAAPVEKGFGVEAITYKGTFDFALVKGLGRVGAAISPSNSEETFFGPPGIETNQDYLERQIARDKYKSEKYTLATAVNVFSNKKSGLKRFDINLGVMGKYNSQTKALTAGAGLSGVLGPLILGYARYKDETLLKDEVFASEQIVEYNVETMSAGLFLGSFILDYSVLRRLSDTHPSTVTLTTGTLLFKRFIFTAALRDEKSDRLVYDSDTQQLLNEDRRKELFGGVQVRALPYLLVGAFFNYYLMHEASFGATLFF